MSVDAHEATWKALRRIVTVLDSNMATELAADAPAGLNATAPASDAYYVKPNERAVREDVNRNHLVQVYVFPSSEREREEASQGATWKAQPSDIEITIAVRVTEELGAADFAETWKTLTPKEREFYRCETLLGAVQDCIDGKVRNADDINHVFFVDSRSGDDRFRAPGDEATWGSVRYRIKQIIRVPIQN